MKSIVGLFKGGTVRRNSMSLRSSSRG